MKFFDGKNCEELTPEDAEELIAGTIQADIDYWKNITYEDGVHIEFRKKYPQKAVEATQNNYMLDPTNPLFIEEMKAMQDYRAECKVYVRLKKGIK